MLKIFYENHMFECVYKIVHEQFGIKFPGRKLPTRNGIKYIVQKFENKGKLENDHKGNAGRIATVLTEPVLDNVREILLTRSFHYTNFHVLVGFVVYYGGRYILGLYRIHKCDRILDNPYIKKSCYLDFADKLFINLNFCHLFVK